jgi:phosphoglycolate phosphatase-like HAD superfamily hydrolase
MNYKCVIFDFDGTLADTEKINFGIFQEIADIYKLEKISFEEMKKLKKFSASEIIDHLNIKKRNIPGMIRKGRRKLHASIEEVDWCRESWPEVIQELKKAGYIIGVITSNSKKNVKKFLKNKNAEYFEFIYNSGLTGKERKIKKVMRKRKLSNEDILYVGDEIRDIKSSHNMKVHIASVDWGYNTRESLERNRPDYIIEEPKELIDILNKEGAGVVG